ncbi:hypothetical protein GGR55DRAFT_71914 [Xylaria sp. FL0064]|nr:hypothetical protein GGR55DRAFT_71914 [Xylaria sp. FL0064]
MADCMVLPPIHARPTLACWLAPVAAAFCAGPGSVNGRAKTHFHQQHHRGSSSLRIDRVLACLFLPQQKGSARRIYASVFFCYDGQGFGGILRAALLQYHHPGLPYQANRPSLHPTKPHPCMANTRELVNFLPFRFKPERGRSWAQNLP